MLAWTAFLTRQTSFPAYFLVQAATHIPATALGGALITLVFQRTSAASPWTVVIDSQQQLVTLNHPFGDISVPDTDDQGFDADPPIAIKGGAAQLPADLALDWESWAQHDRSAKSTPLLPGLWTTEHGPGIWEQEHELTSALARKSL